MIKIINTTPADIPSIRHIATETWWATYSTIITAEQIRYMLHAIYSDEALNKVMESASQTFILLIDEQGPQGFAAYGVKSGEPGIYKLHKIYVLPHNHGKGYGKALVDEVKKRMLAADVNILELNVNKYNKARAFYEKIGFEVIGEEDIPLGPYWMNDLVMRLKADRQSIGALPSR